MRGTAVWVAEILASPHLNGEMWGTRRGGQVRTMWKMWAVAVGVRET
jgi:hypothetical protein